MLLHVWCLLSLVLLHFAWSLAALLAFLFLHSTCPPSGNWPAANRTTSMKLSESDSILFRFDLRVEAPGLVRGENTPATHRHGSSRALLSRLSCDFILIILQRRGTAGSVQTQAVSVPVDWCPWTARHLHLSKLGGGFLCENERVSGGFPGVSEGFRGFHPAKHNLKYRKSCRRYAENQKLRTCV